MKMIFRKCIYGERIGGAVLSEGEPGENTVVAVLARSEPVPASHRWDSGQCDCCHKIDARMPLSS